MKSLKRLLPLLLVMWGWACQTSTTDLQPRSSSGARKGVTKSKIHKLLPRDVNGKKVSVQLVPPSGDPFSMRRPGDGGNPQIDEIDSQIDQVEYYDDATAIDQANVVIDEMNAMDANAFNSSIADFISRFGEILQGISDRFNCVVVSHPEAEQRLRLKNDSYQVKPKNPVDVNKYITWTVVDDFRKLSYGNRGDLNPIIGTSTNLQAHHIIPWGVCNGSSIFTADLIVRQAALAGFHPNDTYNGISLTVYKTSGGETGDGNGVHSNHPQYDEWIKFQLREYQKETSDKVDPAKANEWLQCRLIPRLRREMNNLQGKTLNEYFRDLNQRQTYIGQ